MRSHYRSPPGKWSVATAVVAVVMVVAGGAYAFFGKAAMVALPTVTPPDLTRSFSKSETPYLPSPTVKAVEAPALRSSEAPTRRLGPGIYRCEEANGAVTYSDSPCGDGKLVDTKPTSGGFADNWSISVKHR